jgi:quaternary ammonium compound-resistance protein SugE
LYILLIIKKIHDNPLHSFHPRSKFKISIMSWFYLIIAGAFEIGWPLGFKLSQTTPHKYLWIVFAIVAMAFSGYFLWLAQRTIPMGTAYAVWTGIGAVGAFVIGIILFKDPMTFLRIVSVMLIVTGIVGLKLAG